MNDLELAATKYLRVKIGQVIKSLAPDIMQRCGPSRMERIRAAVEELQTVSDWLGKLPTGDLPNMWHPHGSNPILLSDMSFPHLENAYKLMRSRGYVHSSEEIGDVVKRMGEQIEDVKVSERTDRLFDEYDRRRRPGGDVY